MIPIKVSQIRSLVRNFCSKTSDIIRTDRKNCSIIQLNRPRSLNAINEDMFKNLNVLLNKIQEESKLVIVKGNGRVFSSGGDIKQLSSYDIEQAKNYFRYTLGLFHLVHNYKIPYMGIMNGVTFGAASNLTAAAKKYKIATETTDFAMPEAKIGFLNDNGSSYFLSRLPENIGFYVGLACPRIKGADVLKIGLANYYIENQKLTELEEELINSRNEDIEKILSKFSSKPEETEFDAIIPKIEKCFDGDSVEEIIENLHLDGSDWALETVQSMNLNSPMSLKICHKELSLGKSLSLEDCLKMEYRLAIRHFQPGSDFYEGVRALLINRDNNPQWKYKKLREINEKDVDEYFKPLNEDQELNFST